MRFLGNTKIDFLTPRYYYLGISLFLIAVGIISLIAKGGPNLGIDFTGGILLELRFSQPVNIGDIRKELAEFPNAEIKYIGSDRTISIRVKSKDIDANAWRDRVNSLLGAKYSYVLDRVEYVGPAVGSHLIKQALLAILFSFCGIVIYVALRFRSFIWGAAGVIALIHDVFIVFGLFSVFNREITLTVVAALLTLAGYSINDTIVVFDRIREKSRIMKGTLFEIINYSINETLSRTVITSLTVFLVVLALFLFGGVVIHDFALALLIGVVVGTYSSIYIASAIVYEWQTRVAKR